jgi:hypothetical protein
MEAITLFDGRMFGVRRIIAKIRNEPWYAIGNTV